MSCEISRRDFLLAAAGAAGVLLVGAGGCSTNGEASPSGDSTLPADRVDWTPGTPIGPGAPAPVATTRNPDGTLLVPGGGRLRPGTALAFTMPDDDPGIVCVSNKGEIYALSAKCTHAGCTVVWQRNAGTSRLHCPCHLSNFDMEGRVTNGPARVPLKRYTVRVQGDDAVVTL